MSKILVINGPNLNMLGKRNPKIYGSETYDDLIKRMNDKAAKMGIQLATFQSNSEGAIIDCLQEAYTDGTEGIIINAGAYTHYSYAIHDALEILSIPKIELHISDVDNREDFRKISVISDVCDMRISGHGTDGYIEAIEEMDRMIYGKEK